MSILVWWHTRGERIERRHFAEKSDQYSSRSRGSGYVIRTLLTLVLDIVRDPQLGYFTCLDNRFVSAPVKENGRTLTGLKLLHVGVVVTAEVIPFFARTPVNTQLFQERGRVEPKSSG